MNQQTQDNLPNSQSNNQQQLTQANSNMIQQKPQQMDQDLYFQLRKKHQFWDNQPVPHLKEWEQLPCGPIQQGDLKQVKQQPDQLPDNFKWCQIDLDNLEQANQVYTLLKENYVEDSNAKFRFEYSVDFLKWALHPPGFDLDWLVGVESDNQLVGLISAVPAKAAIESEDQVINLPQVSFLCVHRKLRGARLAPALIKEITRRVHLKNQWQAIQTAATVLPTPFSQTVYFHRAINYKKLIETDFFWLPPNSSLEEQIKLYDLSTDKELPFREMRKEDCKQVTQLLNQYLKKFKIYQIFSEEEIMHWLLPKNNIIYTYVLENNNVITDLFSFYSLPYQVIQNKNYNNIQVAYLFYNVSNTITTNELINQALIIAKIEGFDLFNVLNIMDNQSVFKELKFIGGNGYLNYYLYNWKLEKGMLKPQEVGIILI